eukprot:scaffold18851_cov126-Isochrysis_galbana.AAC.5
MPTATPMASKSGCELLAALSYAQAVLASSCGLNSPLAIRGAASVAIALKRPGAAWPAVAKAHARLASAWASNSASRPAASSAMASKRSGPGGHGQALRLELAQQGHGGVGQMSKQNWRRVAGVCVRPRRVGDLLRLEGAGAARGGDRQSGVELVAWHLSGWAGASRAANAARGCGAGWGGTDSQDRPTALPSRAAGVGGARAPLPPPVRGPGLGWHGPPVANAAPAATLPASLP